MRKYEVLFDVESKEWTVIFRDYTDSHWSIYQKGISDGDKAEQIAQALNNLGEPVTQELLS